MQLGRVLRWLVIAAVACCAVVAIVLIAVLAFRQWAISLFCAYLLGLCTLLVLGLYAHFGQLRADSQYQLWGVVNEALLRKSKRFDRWRLLIASRLLLVCTLLAWPAQLAALVRALRRPDHRMTVTEQGSEQQLNGDVITLQPILMMAMVVVCALGLTVSTQPRYSFLWFAWLAIIYLICLCVAMIVSPGSLALIARRATGSPHLRGFLAAAMAAVIATVSLTIITTHGVLSSDGFWSTARNLNSQLDALKPLLRGESVPSTTLLAGVVGALVAAACLQGLLSGKEFKREDSDRGSIAARKAMLGQYNDAYDALSAVTIETAEILSLRAICLVMLNQFDKGMQAMRRRAQFEDKELSQAQLYHRLLIELWPYPHRAVILQDLFARYLASKPTELDLAQVIEAFIILNKMSPEDLIGVLRVGDAIEINRIIAARLFLLERNIAEASALIEATETRTGALELMQQLNIFLLNVMSETSLDEDAAFFERWYVSKMPTVTSLIDGLQTYEELSVAVNTLMLLLQFSDTYKSERSGELQFRLKEVAPRWKSKAPDRSVIDAIVNRGPLRDFAAASTI